MPPLNIDKMFRQTVTIGITFLISLQVLVSASPQSRIVGGKPEAIGNVPYQVSIQYANQHFCGGSLLNRKIVLTAAHCMDGFTAKSIPNLKAVVGTSTYASGGQRMPVSSYVKHPKYNPKTTTFDVAVVKLILAVTLSTSVQPITMASNVPKDRSLVQTSGWGYLKNNANKVTPNLQSVELTFFTRSSCTKSPNLYTASYISNTMVCAGADGKASCKGDSGGPLVDVQTKQLVGIVSWGFKCAQTGYPTVYTSVPVLKAWIENKARTMRG